MGDATARCGDINGSRPKPKSRLIRVSCDSFQVRSWPFQLSTTGLCLLLSLVARHSASQPVLLGGEQRRVDSNKSWFRRCFSLSMSQGLARTEDELLEHHPSWSRGSGESTSLWPFCRLQRLR